MGLFKDLKKMSDQGKEMNKAMGRPTTLSGMIKDMPNQMAQASQLMDQAQAMQGDMGSQQQILATGTPGRGTIKHYVDTGMIVNYAPTVRMDLEVTPTGGEAYDVQLTTSVPQVYLARLVPGGSVAVKIDPADPASVVIDWTQP
jgi:hypothetical protein